jgi:NADH-quinone oxidoreductase subunit M
MGFVLLGLVTLSQIGLSGAVLQMFSHGIIAGLLFAVVGRMIYDRAHTRELSELQPMNLCALAPFAAVTFIIAGAASMGLPGFSGFIAELQVLAGSWQVFPRLTLFAGLGILLGIAFMVRVWIKAFFAEPGVPVTAIRIDPISIPERAGALVLLAATLLIGLWPGLLLNFITPTLHSPLFQPLFQGGLP